MGTVDETTPPMTTVASGRCTSASKPLFGGTSGSPTAYFDDTWSWDGTTWAQEPTAVTPTVDFHELPAPTDRGHQPGVEAGATGDPAPRSCPGNPARKVPPLSCHRLSEQWLRTTDK